MPFFIFARISLNPMKKKIILFSLFVLPIVAYLFFASGVHSFVKLPVLTPEVQEIPEWQDKKNNTFKLDDKITVLGFPGLKTDEHKGNAFNLNRKIYDKVKDFKDFQLILISPEGTQAAVEEIEEELGRISDLSRWHYVFADTAEIKKFYNGLKLQENLDNDYGTSLVYIVDKSRNLRGRKGKNKKGEQEYKEGYNTISAADLHNEMGDDIKVILAEYRLALKKNSADRKK